MALLAGNLKSKLALAGVGLALAMTPVMAQSKGGHGPRITFEQLDADSNGSITKTEMETGMKAQRDARFASADTNGDGALSADELKAQGQANKDARAERRVERMIERLDANGDGSLSQDELAKAEGQRQGKGEHKGERKGGQKGEHKGERKGKGDRQAKAFERMDKDGNGEISKAEFEEMTKMRRGGGQNKN